MVEKIYDAIIVGAGPAGYTAAIYTTRYNMSTLVLGEEFGGQMNIDYEIENYPGFKKIKANELMQKIHDHTLSLGAEIEADIITEIKHDNIFTLTGMTGKQYKAKTLILALGTKRRKLGIPGEEKFAGRGVSYCATCDSNFFKDKTVAVIGGGDSAFASAFILMQHAKKVYIIHRRDEFRAKPVVVDSMKLNSNVEFVMNTNVKEILGEKNVTKIKTDNPNRQEIEVDGVFIDVGVIPNTELMKKAGIHLDKSSYIQINSKQETNIAGIYAAGDITTGSAGIKQLIIAAAEGAIAANSAFTNTRECNHKLEGGDCND